MIYFQHPSVHFSKNVAFKIFHTENGPSLHFHSAVEFMFIKKGSLKVTLNGKEYLAGEGDLVTVNSGVVHSAKSNGDGLNFYILIADEVFFSGYGLYEETTCFSPIIHSKEISEIFNDIILEYDSENNFKNASITASLISLFITLNKFYKEENRLEDSICDKRVALIRKTLDYINENYKNKLSIDDIADNMNFSKSYLSHVFKSVTGHSIVDYINTIRCQNAKALIQGGYSITQAAFECGFMDVSYFTRTFKNIIGVLPSAIKQKQL